MRINSQPTFCWNRAAPSDANRTSTWHTFNSLSDALDGLARCCAAWFKMSSYNVDGRVPVHVTTMAQGPLHVKGVLLLFSWRIRVYCRGEPYGDCPQANRRDYDQRLE